MLRYVPEFILDRIYANQYQGVLSAYILLLDVANFTPIATALQKEGKRGAEVLSRFMDVAFGTPIQIVNNYGGFVSLFAGDAVCAIFPDAKPESIVSVVNSIRVYFEDTTTLSTSFGEFPVKMRQIISYGTVKWQIFENELQNEYVFFGETMKELADLASLKEDIVFSVAAATRVGLSQFERLTNGYMLSNKTISSITNTLEYHYDPEIISRFIHPKFSTVNPQNEIRNAAYCFANLEGIDSLDRGKAISQIQRLADKYGGFVNKYDATDKGLIAIIIFGLPKSEGNTLESTCNFSLEAVEVNPDLALGISCGSVFAGYTGSGEIKEFTALGQPLNLAARLMGKAIKGQVISATFLRQDMNTRYDFEYLGSLELKGFPLPIRYFSLGRLSQNSSWQQEIRFVGRIEELSTVKDIINNSSENTIIYISGDPGIGKSRLCRETMTGYSNSPHLKFCVSSDAVLRKPLEAIKQIVRELFKYDSQLAEEVGIKRFRARWKSLFGDAAGMQGTESVIASMLGYGWSQSFWSTLPPQERPYQLKAAFIRMMEQLTKTKPIIIFLDDGQWLDQDSKAYFQTLTAKWENPVTILCACRYLDDGQRVDLSLAGYKRIDIELSSLSYSKSKELIKTILSIDLTPESTLQLIYSRSMGYPLFIEQLGSFLKESRFINDDGIITSKTGYLDSFTINDIISSRIDRLSETVQECMYYASVLGIEFNVKVLTHMLGTDPTLELESGKINHIWMVLDEQRYVFSHILIKEVLYQRMMSEKLQTLHQAAAEAMEKIYSESLAENAEEIGMHYEKANQLSKAAEYYDLAGEYYWEVFVLRSSELNFQKSISCWEASLGKQSIEYAESLFHLGLLYHYTRDFTNVESIYKQVLTINEAKRGTDSPLLSPYINNLGRFYKDMGQYADSELLLRRSLQIEIRIEPNSSNVADRQNNLGHLYIIQKKFADAESILTEAMYLLDHYYPPKFWFTAIVLGNLGMIYVQTKKYSEAEPLLRRAHEINLIVNGLENPNSAISLGNLASLYVAQGDFQQAEPLLLSALVIKEKTQGETHTGTIRTLETIFNLYLQTGNLEQAEKFQSKAEKRRLLKRLAGITW